MPWWGWLIVVCVVSLTMLFAGFLLLQVYVVRKTSKDIQDSFTDFFKKPGQL